MFFLAGFAINLPIILPSILEYEWFHYYSLDLNEFLGKYLIKAYPECINKCGPVSGKLKIIKIDYFELICHFMKVIFVEKFFYTIVSNWIYYSFSATHRNNFIVYKEQYITKSHNKPFKFINIRKSFSTKIDLPIKSYYFSIFIIR